MTLGLTNSEMQEKLGQVFVPEQADVLVEILDDIRQAELQRAADTRDLKQGLRTLSEEVQKLTAAQRHTDETVAELATSQRHTDERLAKFEERTEQRFQRTDERLAELGLTVQVLAETVNTGFTELRQAVGSLANHFGFDLEEFVAALLPPYIERHAGVTGLSLERRYFEMDDGRQEEVDLVGSGQQDGQPVTILAECRTTIGGGEMRRLAAKLETIAAGLPGQVLKIVVAMNLHPTGAEAARETGIWAVPYSRINRERE